MKHFHRRFILVLSAICAVLCLSEHAFASEKSETPFEKEREVLFYGEYAYILEDGQATIVGLADDEVYFDSLPPDRLGMTDGNAATPQYDDTKRAMVIPSRLDGHPIVAIGDVAFLETLFTDITIPEGITDIGNAAFGYCYYFSTIIIPNGVIFIDQYAFEYCENLETAILPDSLAFISDGTFQECSSLTAVTLPNGITSIGHKAFYNCGRLTSLTIPNSVIAIGNNAFGGCDGLVSVTIPSSVILIGNDAFEDCDNLILTVAESSYAAQYAEENGIPYKLFPVSVRCR